MLVFLSGKRLNCKLNVLVNNYNYYCSKRTTNRILVNLARDHNSGLLERRAREEKVLAARTWKQARALAREEGAGGVSYFSDNAGKVYCHYCHHHHPLLNFRMYHWHQIRAATADTTILSRPVKSFTNSHSHWWQIIEWNQPI